jgi:hypothetical protein
VIAAEPRDTGTRLSVRVREDQLGWAGEFAVRPVSRRLRLPG